MSENLLIVGGTGFIGRNLAAHALRSGYIVTVLSLNEPKRKKVIDGVKYLQADCTDFIQLQNQLLNLEFQFVVNLSGYIDHSGFFDGGRDVIDTHFVAVQNLVQVLNWNTIKRFVQIGSSDEYGSLSAPQNEKVRESPISPYSVAKVAATHFLQMLYRTNKLPTVILRLFLVYGIGQDNKRFLPQVISGCFSGEQFPVSGGEQLRDFMYVDDVSEGILNALKKDKVLGEVLNLSSGQPRTIKSVIEKVVSIIGFGSPQYGEIPYRKGENMALYADISKARSLLKLEIKTSFEDGLAMVVENYR